MNDLSSDEMNNLIRGWARRASAQIFEIVSSLGAWSTNDKATVSAIFQVETPEILEVEMEFSSKGRIHKQKFSWQSTKSLDDVLSQIRPTSHTKAPTNPREFFRSDRLTCFIFRVLELSREGNLPLKIVMESNPLGEFSGSIEIGNGKINILDVPTETPTVAKSQLN